MENITSSIKLLSDLGLTPSEAKVYTEMQEGHLKVKEIMRATGMKRPSVYYAISNLERRGLIGRIQVGEYNQWKLSPPEELLHILDEKKQNIEDLQMDVEDYITNLKQSKSSEAPKLTYYQGQKSIERVIFDSVYSKKKEILSIAPLDNFFMQVGEEFANKYVDERRKRGIKTKNLWMELLPKGIMELRYKGLSEIRILPASMHKAFKTTTFIYDDKVMYIAPQESNYAVVFESKEHTKMMTSIFKILWSISKPAYK